MVQLALFTDNESESIEYFIKAIKEDSGRWSDEARYYLAMVYKDQKKFSEAFQLFEKAAKNGHEDAMFQVAVFYQNGMGVQKDETQAMNYYAMSANSQNPNSAAQFNYALMLKKQTYEQLNESQKEDSIHEIKKKNKSMQKAHITHCNSSPNLDNIKLYDSIESIEKVDATFFDTDANYETNNNNNNDSFNSSSNFSNRRIIKNNLTRAAKYFRAAALQGDAEAMNNYGLMLMKGEGVDQNLKEARKYFQMSSDHGNSFGQNNLGVLLRNIEPEKATRLFAQSAKQHNLSGMNNYGLMLMKSDDEKDRIEALSLFKTAADEGHPNAMYNYAKLAIKQIKNGFVIYDESDENSIENDRTVSIDSLMEKYMKESADLGDVDAMNSYGSYLYKNKNNEKLAAFYFREAAEAGNASAMNKLASLIKNQLDNEEGSLNEDVEKLKQEMLDWFECAMNIGNINAMNNLASLYYTGSYVEKDVEKAKMIYKKAMELGSAKAAKNYKIVCSPRKH